MIYDMVNVKYMTYNTHTTSSRPTIHALQVLVTYMHNTINIFHQDPKWVCSSILHYWLYCIYIYIQFSNACGIQGIEIELWLRTERFCLQASPPTQICLACLMRVLNVKCCVW